MNQETLTLEPPAQGKRLLFVDALRGFTMFWIIGGDTLGRSLQKAWPNALTAGLAHQLEHADWEGFTFYDLVFPLFLLIVGAVVPYAILGRLEKGQSKISIYCHILKRTLVLIFWGLVAYGLLRFDWPNMRWSTVLGRIGVCYCAASILALHTTWRTQAAVAAALVAAYWAAMTFIPVPGYGAGVLTPQGSLSTYLDQHLIPGKLGVDNLYDRQGVLSTFTAIATTLIGVLIGHWLRSDRSAPQKLKGMIMAAVALLIAGAIWGRFFPISRNIWSSSFVLYSAGWGLLLFSLFYRLIDIAGFRKWSFFFVVIGANAIAIWIAQGFINFGPSGYYAGKASDSISSFFLGGLASRWFPSCQPVIIALGAILAKWLVLWAMFKHRVFLKA
ncbi:MAG: acyltransferase family protein [Limisphaerales bacterium]